MLLGPAPVSKGARFGRDDAGDDIYLGLVPGKTAWQGLSSWFKIKDPKTPERVDDLDVLGPRFFQEVPQEAEVDAGDDAAHAVANADDADAADKAIVDKSGFRKDENGQIVSFEDFKRDLLTTKVSRGYGSTDDKWENLWNAQEDERVQQEEAKKASLITEGKSVDDYKYPEKRAHYSLSSTERTEFIESLWNKLKTKVVYKEPSFLTHDLFVGFWRGDLSKFDHRLPEDASKDVVDEHDGKFFFHNIAMVSSDVVIDKTAAEFARLGSGESLGSGRGPLGQAPPEDPTSDEEELLPPPSIGGSFPMLALGRIALGPGWAAFRRARAAAVGEDALFLRLLDICKAGAPVLWENLVGNNDPASQKLLPVEAHFLKRVARVSLTPLFEEVRNNREDTASFVGEALTDTDADADRNADAVTICAYLLEEEKRVDLEVLQERHKELKDTKSCQTLEDFEKDELAPYINSLDRYEKERGEKNWENRFPKLTGKGLSGEVIVEEMEKITKEILTAIMKGEDEAITEGDGRDGHGERKRFPPKEVLY